MRTPLSPNHRLHPHPRSDPARALAVADSVSVPWYRAVAMAWAARFTDADPVAIARLAAEAAANGIDAYQRSAGRAWEIVALADRHHPDLAELALHEAVAIAEGIQPISPRSEALLLLFQAACYLGPNHAKWVAGRFHTICPEAKHWRAKRARREIHRILAGESQPRLFFW
jgi:hypothetical protein